MIIQPILQKIISQRFTKVGNVSIQHIGGGSINDAYKISFSDKALFCKINSATKFPHLFSKENNGLQTISKQGVIQTPPVIDCFEEENKQFLFLEWIHEGEQTEIFWKKFGEQLALLHKVSDSFHGLNEDNYMGSVPQSNTRHENWCNFFAEERLSPMIKRCAEKQFLNRMHLVQFDILQKKLQSIFEEEKPALLHGDLWSGNFLCSQKGEPVLIDPAVYYGHRSMDLAMTTLFGGFKQPFYEAYHSHFPFPSNHKEQWSVCNLYPLLIHLYLFGSSYLPQIQTILKQFA